MALNVSAIERDDEGRGTLTATFSSLAEFKAAIAHLHPGTVVFDRRGDALGIKLGTPAPAEPVEFPTEATLPIEEWPLPPDAPRFRARFGNNYLQAGLWVDVVEFLAPTEDGAEGWLRVSVDSADEYAEVLRFVTEPHGSALLPQSGAAQSFVHLVGDAPIAPNKYPAVVSFTVEWLRR